MTTKTPEERAREIVTRVRGKFVNWENAEPLANEIAQAIRESEQRTEKSCPTKEEFLKQHAIKVPEHESMEPRVNTYNRGLSDAYDLLIQHAAPNAAVSEDYEIETALRFLRKNTSYCISRQVIPMLEELQQYRAATQSHKAKDVSELVEALEEK